MDLEHDDNSDNSETSSSDSFASSKLMPVEDEEQETIVTGTLATVDQNLAQAEALLANLACHGPETSTEMFEPELEHLRQRQERISNVLETLRMSDQNNMKSEGERERERKNSLSSVIHSARPTVSSVVNIVFTGDVFCFARF